MYYHEHGYILFKHFFQSVICRIIPVYENVYSHKLPAISDLQLEGDDLTCPPFYRFTDYLDLLNERIHTLCHIVKEHYNQTIEKRLQKHGSESTSLRSFKEGDIVYCHFPSKTVISGHNLPSKS